MLDVLRKRKRSWVVTFLLALIVVVFVLFYGGNKMREQGSEKVAEVNGETISQQEFAVQYQKLGDMYRDLFKGQLTPEAIKNLKLKSTAMENLIDRRLLLQESRRLRLDVSDEELMSAIARAPEFQIDGRFSKNRYLQVLAANRLNPTRFEDEQREQLLIQKLSDVVQDAARVSENEVRERYAFAEERVNFHFIRLAAPDFLPQAGVTEEEIKSYYERNKAALTEPLKVRVEYVVYPFEQFAGKAEVSDKEIEAYYQAHREAEFHQQKSFRMRRILLRIPAGGDAGQAAAARARAEAALKEARAGKNFTDLVKQYSEDPGAAQGGDTGWIAQGQLIKSLDEPVFKLKKGDVSAVLESPAGYHIFKIEDVKEEKKTGLKEAAPGIVRALKAEKGKSEAARAADQDREKASSGTDLSLLARPRGLTAKMTPLFGAADTLPDVAPGEDFKKTALAAAVKEVGPAVEAPNGYYLLRVAERKEPALPPLAAVHAEVERRAREAKALELAKKKAEALVADLKKEKDVDRVARANGVPVGETGWFTRSAPEIPKVGALADLKPGGVAISAAKPVADRPFAQNGSVYLFVFKAGQGADMERFDREKARLMEQALADKRQAMMKKFVDSLKAGAKIKLEPTILEES